MTETNNLCVLDQDAPNSSQVQNETGSVELARDEFSELVEVFRLLEKWDREKSEGVVS